MAALLAAASAEDSIRGATPAAQQTTATRAAAAKRCMSEGLHAFASCACDWKCGGQHPRRRTRKHFSYVCKHREHLVQVQDTELRQQLGNKWCSDATCCGWMASTSQILRLLA